MLKIQMHNAGMANDLARSLRKRMTPQEVRVWLHLRALRPQGFHFRRQVPIGSYIVDFACKRARLVVEIDGGQHGMPDHLAADAARDRVLDAAGFKVLRFWNVEVERSIQSVIDTVFENARVRLGDPSHAAAGEGGTPEA